VFEGLKAFRAKDGSVRIFRPTANAARMRHSADIVSMPEIPESIFVEGCERAVAGNLEFVPYVEQQATCWEADARRSPYAPNAGGGALYLRPLYFGSGENLILNPPSEFTFLVFVTPVGALYGGGKGVGSVDGQVMEDFDRSAPKGTGYVSVLAFMHDFERQAALPNWPATTPPFSSTPRKRKLPVLASRCTSTPRRGP
jgi:branched-chain amino acid aminotransferase